MIKQIKTKRPKSEFSKQWILNNGISIVESYNGNITLRALHYRLVALGMTNDLKHYKKVVHTMINARWEGQLFEPEFADHLGAGIKYIFQGLFTDDKNKKERIKKECITDTTRTYIYQVTIPGIDGQPETKQEFKELQLQLT